MPLVRKLLIIAAVDGVLLLPSGPRSRTNLQTKIAYKSGAITSFNSSDTPSSSSSSSFSSSSTSSSTFEAHGIAGLITLPGGSWLIAITRRDPVAEIKGRQIYVITDIALIPLSSRVDAEAAIIKFKSSRTKRNGETTSDEDETDDEDDTAITSDDELPDDHTTNLSQPGGHKRTTSIAEDVIGKKGVYGRFAERWFSKRGWQVDQSRLQGMSGTGAIAEDVQAPKPEESGDKTEGASAPGLDEVASRNQAEVTTDPDKPKERMDEGKTASDEKVETVSNSLTPKLLRTTKLLLASSRSFYFSYDYDITRSLNKQQLPSSSGPSLFKMVDPTFFWNHHLINPFIEARQDHFVLPLVQGFVTQSPFQIPSSDGSTRNFLLTLLSRRSINRAGLRYLRRGVDEDGNVANCVETEQLLTDADDMSSYSFVQMRGSIPVFFQQSPYALKPKPVLMQSPEANKAAFTKHFKHVRERYGKVQVINLVERHGNEAVAGDLYEKRAQEMDEPKIGFEWFDFHSECRGMKFENVSKLLDRMGGVIVEFGWTEEKDEKIGRQQSGVLRTNCMDCLDRTNVVQSACARKVVEEQLAGLGVDASKIDSSTAFMNMLWADNGDAISKQYSSTAALKGDFTRTKKRNISGALTDFGLTLSRYWNNIIGDFFTQAAIDFLLGNVSAQVFVEFETNMMSGDPAVSMKKIRQNAIETSSKIVIANASESLLAGHTLLSPAEDNTTKTDPFQETVLLLTDAAIYFCRFDFTMEKVLAFERISLENLRQVYYGTYITSTLSPSSTDVKHNVGFVIKYLPGKDDHLRINTRSMTSNFSRGENNKITPSQTPNEAESEDATMPETSSPTAEEEEESTGPEETRILAFKALPTDSTIPRSTTVHTDGDELAIVSEIVHEIERLYLKATAHGKLMAREDTYEADTDEFDKAEGGGKDKEKEQFLVEQDVVGLAEAKKSTGLLEQVGYSIRRLVWA